VQLARYEMVFVPVLDNSRKFAYLKFGTEPSRWVATNLSVASAPTRLECGSAVSAFVPAVFRLRKPPAGKLVRSARVTAPAGAFSTLRQNHS
jgi:hypothetical protein